MSSLKDKLAKHKASKSSSETPRVENLADVLGAEERYSSVLAPKNSTPKLQSAPLVDIDLIDPDPDQARKEFDQQKLEGLAKSIEIRSKEGKVGVKQPISIRENPDQPGRYMINHGERRWRASKIANQTTIPAHLDNDYTDDDGVVENVQRDELTPREIADYIGRQLSKGRKKGEIAESLGKSNAYISQHCVLLDLPDPIADSFNAGRINDVTVINELVKAHKEDNKATEEWLADESQVVNRASVDELRQSFSEPQEDKHVGEPEESDDDVPSTPTTLEVSSSQGMEEAPKQKTKPKENDPDKFKKAIVMVSHDERQARLLLDRRPTIQGQAWLKYEDDGHEFESALADIQITALIEG